MPRPSVQAPRLDSETFWAPVPWQCCPGQREAPERPCSRSYCASLRPRQECLSRLLSPCGPVHSVELQEKPDLAESPKEPKSKFFHPKPVPVSLHYWGLLE